MIKYIVDKILKDATKRIRLSTTIEPIFSICIAPTRAIFLSRHDEMSLPPIMLDNNIFEGMFKLTTENLQAHNNSLKEEYSIENEKCSNS